MNNSLRGLLLSACFLGLLTPNTALASDETKHNHRKQQAVVTSDVGGGGTVELNTQKPTEGFKPSTQVHYEETVVIKAPTPEKDEPQPLPIKRFRWLNIESKPLNPTQQNR
jgi:hypothetical protein